MKIKVSERPTDREALMEVRLKDKVKDLLEWNRKMWAEQGESSQPVWLMSELAVRKEDKNSIRIRQKLSLRNQCSAVSQLYLYSGVTWCSLPFPFFTQIFLHPFVFLWMEKAAAQHNLMSKLKTTVAWCSRNVVNQESLWWWKQDTTQKAD